ncbi:MAG: metallophosphoesterase [Chitinophagales bacterium]|nr:metallophosphoesterase [Chitinophagales bacterium]
MINYDNKYKIIWISDLHISVKYDIDTDNFLKQYLANFIEIIKKELNESPIPIRYILFTGDIAQSGCKEDYEKFRSLILDDLLNLFENQNEKPILFFLPGNHDITYEDNFDYIENFISFTEVEGNAQSAFFNDNKDKFISPFTPFTDFVQKVFDEKKEFFSNFETSNFKKNLTYFKVDHNVNSIFILLNSSWVSYGIKFNQMLVDWFVKNKSNIRKKIKDYTSLTNLEKELYKKLLKEKERFNEYGSQRIFVNYTTEIEEIKKKLLEFPDYLVVVGCHHPLEWLNEDEYFMQSKIPSLKEILDMSDIFLSSHIHANILSLNDRVSYIGNAISLKSGRFLPFVRDKFNTESLKGNWFSILEINLKTKTMTQKSFDISFGVTSKKELIYKLENLQNRGCLTDERLKWHKSKLKQIKNVLRNYIKQQINANISYTDSMLENNVFIIDNSINIYLDNFNLTNNPYANHIEKLILFFKRNLIDFNIKIIRFFIYEADLFERDSFIKIFNLDRNKTRELYAQAIEIADFNFDSFRKDFFKKVGTEKDKDIFMFFMNIQFSNHVIPYDFPK